MRFSIFILVLLLGAVSKISYGQLSVVPINPSTSEKSKPNARNESNSLTLPFWDDFSFTKGQVPLDSLWQNSNAVYVGNGIAVNPPSIGVASLDGINAQGEGYTGGTTGPTDALTSCPINLSSLSVGDEVFLSFYYQFAGNGEAPEESDSLRVEMLYPNTDTTAIWIPVWPNGEELDRSGDFVQALVRLDSTAFFFDGFQFRFQNFGRPRGFFDVWNIDYVYLNSGRTINDDNFPDRTIGEPLTSIFDGFTAIPSKHFRISQLKIPSYVVTSVDNPNDDRQPYDNFFSTSVTSWNDSMRTIDNSAVIFRDTESLSAPSRVEEMVDNLFNTLLIPEGQDSVFIEVNTFISATDNVLPPTGDYDLRYDPIDFRSNDSTKRTFVLKDYYAYDDGAAEVAAGLNFSGNQLAIKYPVTPGVNDTIVAVDMFFPLTQNEPAGRSVNLRIWDMNDTIPGEILYNEDLFILRDSLPNAFIRYTFRTPVPVADTFFIGYRQNNEGILGVGFDIQNNSIDQVLYNVGDQWQLPSEFLKGSFMIRPVFGNTVPEVINSLSDEVINEVILYPNPTNGLLKVRGTVQNLRVFDLFGREVQVKISYEDKETTINLYNQSAGIYIVSFINQGRSKSLKIIKQ